MVIKQAGEQPYVPSALQLFLFRIVPLLLLSLIPPPERPEYEASPGTKEYQQEVDDWEHMTSLFSDFRQSVVLSVLFYGIFALSPFLGSVFCYYSCSCSRFCAPDTDCRHRRDGFWVAKVPASDGLTAAAFLKQSISYRLTDPLSEMLSRKLERLGLKRVSVSLLASLTVTLLEIALYPGSLVASMLCKKRRVELHPCEGQLPLQLMTTSGVSMERALALGAALPHPHTKRFGYTMRQLGFADVRSSLFPSTFDDSCGYGWTKAYMVRHDGHDTSDLTHVSSCARCMQELQDAQPVECPLTREELNTEKRIDLVQRMADVHHQARDACITRRSKRFICL